MAITVEQGDVKKIKVEGEGGKGKEVTVRHDLAFPQRKTWHYEDFSRDWNKSYSSKKTKIDLK